MTREVLPAEKEKVRLEDAHRVAAGPPAVLRSFRDGIGEMGLGKCVKTYNKLNQVDGHDCPSCAWPDPRPGDRSAIAEYCENGAKAVADEGTKARAGLDFWKSHSVSELQGWSEHRLGKSGRITHPMILQPGATHYEPIGWDGAFELIGNALQDLSTPDEAVFYTSGRTSNEAAFLYQLFVREFGTNNLPDCSNMCHETTSVALDEAIGIGKGTVKLEDFYVADCILVIGQNPGTNHPRMLSALQKAKRKGAKIISINPLPETGLMAFKNPQEVRGWVGSGTDLSDLFLQVRVNGDVALLKGILLALYRMERQRPGEVFDHEFIAEYTSGYEDFVADLEGRDLDELAAQCGIARADIERAAEIIAGRKRLIICWAMGITQHENGVENVQEIVNLQLVQGSIGIPGAGLCPVRGHSNVQGDRTVGVWDQLTPELRRGLESRFGFEPPRENGYDVVRSIQAMAEGKVKVFVSMGGNLVLAAPDTGLAAEAMRACDLTVMVSTKPNRNHLVSGKTALILPCLGRTEKDLQETGPQFVTTENSMGVVQKSEGWNDPASPELLSEPAIVAGMATATLGAASRVEWREMVSDYDHIRAAIEACVDGFTNYNQRVREPGGFYLPNPATTREFHTSDGKAHFNAVPLPEHDLAADEYLMTTLRSHDQFNTTIYGERDRYRGIESGRRVVMMNEADLRRAGLECGDYVNLESRFRGEERVAENFSVVPYDIPAGCVATFFPEANVLVPVGQYAEKAQTPASKSVRVRVRPLAARGRVATAAE